MQLLINGNLPIITTNFELIKLQLQEKLSQYSLIVSEDDVATAKKSATEINALKGNIDSLRKAKIKEFSSPINAFDNQAKELIGMCDKARQDLLAQVAEFENERKKECKSMLDFELEKLYNKFKVNKSFQTVKVDDLAIMSNLNKSGTLAKKASDTIEERVLKALELQKAIDTRLLQLEGFCYKNGLTVPFSKEHVEHFLMIEDDLAYEQKLLSLIQSELTRQEQIKAKAEKEAMAKAMSAIEANLPKAAAIQVESTSHLTQKSQQSEPKPQLRFDVKAVKKTGIKKRFTVTAVFEIETDEGFEEHLEAMLLDKFDAACIKTMPEITILKHHNSNSLIKEGSLF